MEAAYYHLPSPSDSERLRPYLQRQPIATPPHFPQVRAQSLHVLEQMFSWLLSLFIILDTTSTFGYNWFLSTSRNGNAFLRVLLHGGYEGAVSGGKGSQEAKLEVSHEVHDVVPTTRGAKNHQRGVWAGEIAFVDICALFLFFFWFHALSVNKLKKETFSSMITFDKKSNKCFCYFRLIRNRDIVESLFWGLLWMKQGWNGFLIIIQGLQ